MRKSSMSDEWRLAALLTGNVCTLGHKQACASCMHICHWGCKLNDFKLLSLLGEPEHCQTLIPMRFNAPAAVDGVCAEFNVVIGSAVKQQVQWQYLT